MNEDGQVNWDVQLDRALMNAAGSLADAEPPSNLEEACLLANSWLNVADSWSRRQDNELEFAKWAAETELEDV